MIPRVKPFIKPEWSDYLKNYLINNFKFNDTRIIERLERKVCEYLGAKFAVAVNSGTNGILLSLLALGLEEGDEVVIPNYGHLAALNCILMLRLKPVLADLKEETMSIDIDTVNCSDRTKALIQIQNNGCMSNDLSAVKDFCELKNLVFIEDACPSFGQKYYDLFAGTVGDFGVISFSDTKALWSGEGGVIITNDRTKHKKLKALRTESYITPLTSANFNLSTLLAAFLIPQFDSVEEVLNKRAEIHQNYLDEGIDVYSCPGVTDYYPTMMYIAKKPQDVYDKLTKFDIEIRYKYYPLFNEEIGDAGLYPVSESIRRRVIDLPFFMDMSGSDVRAVANLIKMAEK